MQYGSPLSVDSHVGLLSKSGSTNPPAHVAYSHSASAELRIDLVQHGHGAFGFLVRANEEVCLTGFSLYQVGQTHTSTFIGLDALATVCLIHYRLGQASHCP